MTTQIYNKKCYVCNIAFTTKNQRQKNCSDHTGMHHKTNRVNDGVHQKKCSKCRTWKKVDDFYHKTGGSQNMKSSFCKKCMNECTLKKKNHKGITRKLQAIIKMGGSLCLLWI